MSRIFVTSDTHFNHKNICGPTISSWDKGYRHFTSLDQMNATIIDNINAMVGENDILWHLGDFAFGDKSQIPNLRGRINCKTIHLLLGNHDECLDYDGGHNPKFKPDLAKCFQSIGRYKELRVHGVLVTLFHYPIGSWNEIGRGAIQLHGHCHNTYSRTIGRQKDAGLDACAFHPLLLEDTVADMLRVEPQAVDHHSAKTNYH